MLGNMPGIPPWIGGNISGGSIPGNPRGGVFIAPIPGRVGTDVPGELFMLFWGTNIGMPRFIIETCIPGIPGIIGRGNIPCGPGKDIIIGLKVCTDGMGMVGKPFLPPIVELPCKG
jgi:hypothetical protein